MNLRKNHRFSQAKQVMQEVYSHFRYSQYVDIYILYRFYQTVSNPNPVKGCRRIR